MKIHIVYQTFNNSFIKMLTRRFICTKRQQTHFIEIIKKKIDFENDAFLEILPGEKDIFFDKK